MKIYGETCSPYKGFDIWMAGNSSLGDRSKSCIAIEGRCVKRYQDRQEWKIIELRCKKVIDHFWSKPNAKEKYNILKKGLLQKSKDYIDYADDKKRNQLD